VMRVTLFRLLVCWYESRRVVTNQLMIDTSDWEGGFFNHALRKRDIWFTISFQFHFFWVVMKFIFCLLMRGIVIQKIKISSIKNNDKNIIKQIYEDDESCISTLCWGDMIWYDTTLRGWFFKFQETCFPFLCVFTTHHL
jgi:hypothetical protein